MGPRAASARICKGCTLTDGLVDQYSVPLDRTTSTGEDTLGPVYLRGGGGEGGQYRVDLARMDAELATHSQIARVLSIAHCFGRVVQGCSHPVKRPRQAPKTRGDHQFMACGAQGSHPTSKQIAFAERLARIKRRAVPDECFRDKGLMSKWIDGNR